MLFHGSRFLCEVRRRIISCVKAKATFFSPRQRKTFVQVFNKQYVPSDSFGGISPEKKASKALRTLFTFAAVRIILAQLEGSGRGSLASYNQEAYNDLVSFLQSEPLKDGDEWIQKLMLKNSMLGLRVLEVRLAYSLEDFEYDQLERLAKKDMQEANVMLMRSFATTNFENAARSAESNIISSVTQSPAEDKEEQQQQQQQQQQQGQ